MAKMTHSKPKAVPTAKTAQPKRRLDPLPLAICAFLVIVTALAYVRVAGLPFVDMDDGPYVYQNQHVQDPITARSLHWALTTYHAANWHPLTWISHMIDCSIYGLSHPGGHHITNLILHILNALLLFVLLSRMTGSTWRSGFVAGLFALHPLHVESVAWVSERKDVLSTFFLLVTILAYYSYENAGHFRPFVANTTASAEQSRECSCHDSYATKRGIWRYVLVVALYICGLMAKPMLVSLPLVLLMLDWWPLKRFNTGRARLIIEKLPLFALALASCGITYLAQMHGHAVRTLISYPVGARLANALVSYIEYILRMLWPAALSPIYPHPGGSLPIWQVVASASALLIITYLAIRNRRKAPYVLIGWLWFVVTLIPVIGLVQVGMQGMADRYTYVPLIGLFVILAWGVPDLATRRLGPSAGTKLGVLALAVLIALGARTWAQVGYWNSTNVLLAHAFELSNRDDGVRVIVAQSLHRSGESDKAVKMLSEARVNSPDFPLVCNGLGVILMDKGRLKEAEGCFRMAISRQPDFAPAHCDLGSVLQLRNRPDEAEREYRQAISLDPWYYEPHLNLGTILALQAKPREAIIEYSKAASLDPESADPVWRTALALSQQGQAEAAFSTAKDAVDLDPYSYDAHYLLGCLLRQRGGVDEALVHFREAATIRPEAGPPHYSIAMALFTQGDYAGAWRETKLARRCGVPISPTFTQALSRAMPEPK